MSASEGLGNHLHVHNTGAVNESSFVSDGTTSIDLPPLSAGTPTSAETVTQNKKNIPADSPLQQALIGFPPKLPETNPDQGILKLVNPKDEQELAKLREDSIIPNITLSSAKFFPNLRK